jgi:hypothetical protein
MSPRDARGRVEGGSGKRTDLMDRILRHIPTRVCACCAKAYRELEEDQRHVPTRVGACDRQIAYDETDEK